MAQNATANQEKGNPDAFLRAPRGLLGTIKIYTEIETLRNRQGEGGGEGGKVGGEEEDVRCAPRNRQGGTWGSKQKVDGPRANARVRT